MSAKHRPRAALKKGTQNTVKSSSISAGALPGGRSIGDPQAAFDGADHVIDPSATELMGDDEIMIGFDTEYVQEIPSELTSGDFKQLDAFLARLKTASDPVSEYLRDQLRSEVRGALDTLPPGSEPAPKGVHRQILEALGNIINGESIYESERFANVDLQKSTARLLDLKPEGPSLVRLNRSLLEAAYPEEIRPYQAKRNQILSYQYCAIDRRGRAWKQLIAPPAGERITLRNFLKQAVQVGLERQYIDEWPKVIHLIGHFTMADIPGFKDFSGVKTQFDALRRTFVTLEKPFIGKLAFTKGHCHSVKVFLRDTMLLAPQGEQSLKKLGKLVELDKEPLDTKWIENMDLLRRDDPAKFEQYALRDAEVCVAYALRMLQLRYRICPDHNQQVSQVALPSDEDKKPKIKKVPTTLSAIGLSYLQHLWKWGDRKFDRLRLMGLEEKTERTWHPAEERIIPEQVEVPIPTRYFQELLATECYHGGRNEQYLFGAGQRGTWIDFDLRGAYPTAMSLIGRPKWNEIEIAKELERYQPDTLGFAHVSFQFPAGSRFPCLPIRTAFGLIFPLEGETCCCAPEIFLARQMGAEVKITYGAILPVDDRARPFEEFIVNCTERRNEAKQAGSRIEELLWKEMLNSTYGKTAQGLRQKRCFDTRTGEHAPLPASPITNPFMAAFVTSFIRAALGEILWKLPATVHVCSATTDGFLSTATQAQAEAAVDGPVCTLFSAARNLICGDPRVLDQKCKIARPLGWRTRGQATLEFIEGEEKFALAKAGLKPGLDADVADDKRRVEENKWIIESFLERTEKSFYQKKVSRSFREVYDTDADWMIEERESALSMEFDWKRKPVNAMMRPNHDVEHLAFETLPWTTAAEHAECRERWEAYNKYSRKVLKQVEDLKAFQRYERKDRSRPELNGKGGVLGYAIRMLLKAYKASRCGLSKEHFSYGDLALRLSKPGSTITEDQVKRAKADKFEAHKVPRDPDVMEFFDHVKLLVPGFDPSELLEAPEATAFAPNELTFPKQVA
jgi:hypothetical protein